MTPLEAETVLGLVAVATLCADGLGARVEEPTFAMVCAVKVGTTARVEKLFSDGCSVEWLR